MEIRAEQAGDVESVRAVNLAAFETALEADLVEALRAQVGDGLVSLVAVVDDAIVGHILFSPVTSADSGARVMGLAPMAVMPAHQRRGVGSALVRQGLDACRQRGVAAVVVVGHPTFYPRFGFVPGSTFGLACEYEVPDDVFMAMELVPGGLGSTAGLVRFHPAFP